jgi:hypothetical protein
MRSTMRHEFETRSLPRSLAATRRGFTFYVAGPLSSIHEVTRIETPISPIRTNRFRKLSESVIIRVIRVLTYA